MPLQIIMGLIATFVELRSGSEMERLILDVRLQEVGVAPKESIQNISA